MCLDASLDQEVSGGFFLCIVVCMYSVFLKFGI